MAVERALVAGADDRGDLGREKTLEAAGAFDLAELRGDARLERLVPLGEFARLRRDLVVQRLQPQHRAHARDQRALIDRLGEIFVGAGVQSRDHVLGVGPRRHQDDRHERQRCIRLEAPAYFDAVDLRHHHVEQDEIGPMRVGRRKSLLAVRGLDEAVIVHREPRHENVAVHLVVIDDENDRRIVHGSGGRNWRILASSARGL